MSEVSAGLEQKRAQGKIRYAGFWIRLAAQIIDSIIMVIIMIPFAIAAAFIFTTYFGSSGNAGEASYWLIITVFVICIMWLYEAGFQSSRYMGTPGKMFCGIAVTDMQGNRISFGKATLRYVFKMLVPTIFRMVSESLSCLSFLYYAGDSLFIVTQENKQSLHDIIAGTLVIHKYDKYGEELMKS